MGRPEDADHIENGNIQMPQSSDSPPNRRRSSSETFQTPFTGNQGSQNGIRGSDMSARFSESSNDSFVFGVGNGEMIRLADLQPEHWPENDVDDPELVMIENHRAHNVDRMLLELEEGQNSSEECSELSDEEEQIYEKSREVQSQAFEINNENHTTESNSPEPSCSKDEFSDIQLIRKRNRELIMAALEETKDREMEAELGRIEKAFLFSCAGPSKKNTGLKRKRVDESVRFNVKIPLERRTSKRLKKETPDYSEKSLETLEGSLRTRLKDEEADSAFESMEEVVYQPKQTRSHFSANKYMIRVEDVTQEMLGNILQSSGKKQYSATGTTCHQCRQKTIDQKTSCRNSECSGFRGVFCGVCLKTRYGQDCAEALLDPNWFCPPCRGRCNCSICRTREGKRPTGILYPIATSSGYQSVDHFLVDLKNIGDKPKSDEFEKDISLDPEALLGFSDGGSTAHLQGGTVSSIDCNGCAIRERNNPENLLGFDKDGASVMGGNKVEPRWLQPKE